MFGQFGLEYPSIDTASPDQERIDSGPCVGLRLISYLNEMGEEIRQMKLVAIEAQPPFRLNNLPEELILRIFEYFDHSQYTKTFQATDRSPPIFRYGINLPRPRGVRWPDGHKPLRNLCLTSRRMYQIAKQILVREILDDGREPTRQMWILRFIRDPVAAASVRVVYLHHEGKIKTGTDHKGAGIGNVLEAQQAINAVDIEAKKKWKKALRDAATEAQLPLLLSLLPNVQVIDFYNEDSHAFEYPWTMAFMRRATERATRPGSGTHCLSRLTTILSNIPDVHIRAMTQYFNSYFGTSPTALACAMGLPALQELQVHRAYATRENDYDVSELCSHDDGVIFKSKIMWPQRTSNVERLGFEESYVDAMFLRNIITACRTLRVFSFSWPKPYFGNNLEAGVTGLLQSLSIHKNTLEILSLEMGGMRDKRFLEPIGSFAEFRALKRLKISGHLLIGTKLLPRDVVNDVQHENIPDYITLTEIFPSSLGLLEINHAGEEPEFMMNLLSKVAAARKNNDKLPNLCTVDLRMWSHAWSKWSSMDEVGKDFQEAGVEFLSV